MVIFDFDQTLVNTQPLERLRASRQWNAVMARLGELEIYDEVEALLWDLDSLDELMAIVTSSPSMIPKRFIALHKWPIKVVIGYHDVRKHKPDPEALLLALKRAGITDPAGQLHVGDRAEDTKAAREAGMTAIGAGWGLFDTRELEASRPDHLFMTVRDFRRFFWNEFGGGIPEECL